MRRLIALSTLLLVTLAGCGGGDSGTDSGTDSGADTSSSSDGGEPAAEAPADICGTVAADDVGAAMGVTVTAEDVPGGGCSYEQEDPRAASASVSTVPTTDSNGGFEAAVTGARAVLTEVEESPVSGIGDQAIILSGTFSGMGSQATTGLVDLGGYAVLVQVLGGDTATHADLTEAVMKVAVDAMG